MSLNAHDFDLDKLLPPSADCYMQLCQAETNIETEIQLVLQSVLNPGTHFSAVSFSPVLSMGPRSLGILGENQSEIMDGKTNGKGSRKKSYEAVDSNVEQQHTDGNGKMGVLLGKDLMSGGLDMAFPSPPDLGALTNRIETIKELLDLVAVLRQKGAEGKQIGVERMNVHMALECIRLVSRVVSMHEKLITAVKSNAVRELAKAAVCYSEIQQIFNEKPDDMFSISVDEIDIIQDKKPSVENAGLFIRIEATKALNIALESGSQIDIGAILQVFFNLGELQKMVGSIVDRYLANIADSIRLATNMTQLMSDAEKKIDKSKPGSATKMDTVAWKNSLWSKLTTSLELIYTLTVSVCTLQRVLERKEDGATHTLFISLFEENVCDKYWKKMCALFETEIEAAANNAKFVKSVFVTEYPRLMNLLESIGNKIFAATKISATSTSLFDINLLVGSITIFQNAFLTRSFSRLNEPVHLMFGSSKIPSSSEIHGFIGVITSELDVIASTPALLDHTLHFIAKSVQLFASQCEQRIEANERSSEKNIALFTIIIQLESALNYSSLVAHFPASQQAYTLFVLYFL